MSLSRLAVASLVSCLASRTPAHAALITDTLLGVVTAANGTTSLALVAGDSVSLSATYDDALVNSVGPTTIQIDSDPAFALSVTLGPVTLIESQDVSFGSGYPKLFFADGDLEMISFFVEPFSFGGSDYEFISEPQMVDAWGIDFAVTRLDEFGGHTSDRIEGVWLSEGSAALYLACGLFALAVGRAALTA